MEEEYFISCEAFGSTYTTTMSVRRPANARKASGTVIVESTHHGNLWPVLNTTQQYLADAGHVWVAVSAAPMVVDRFVKPANPARYDSLSVAEEAGMELEILAQVGALLQRDPQDGPLPGVGVKHVLLAGFSGSAAVVRDYITAKHADARIDGGPVYEGYFPGQAAVGTVPGPIPDLDVPVIEIQGEREVIVTLEQNPEGLAYRRPDGRNYRLYEVAALPHLTTENGPSPLYPDPRCAWPEGASISPFPLTHMWNMALDNLVTWVGKGVPAPHAQRIELAGDGRTVVRDAHGNAMGGVPTAYVKAPVSTLVSTSTTGPDTPPGTRCDMLGYQVAFDDEKLSDLYGSHGGYIKQFSRQLDALVSQRWYLPADAKTARIEAAQSDVLS